MGNEDVTVYVGPQKKIYLLHKQLLMSGSTYFEKALTGCYKEAEEGIIYLEEETTDAFDLLVRWLYQHKIIALKAPFGKIVPKKGPKRQSQAVNKGSIPRTRNQQSPMEEFSNLIVPLWNTNGTIIPGCESDHEMTDAIPVRTNPGTGTLQFSPFIESATFRAAGTATTWDRYVNVTLQEGYRHWSTEELHLADYEAGRKARFLPPELPFTPHNSPAISAQTKDTFTGATGHITGIPKCQTVSEIVADEEKKQLALLQLCMMAETMCWDRLFNAAMTAYTQTEAVLQSRRPYPASHIYLIYSRSHAESPSRRFAAESAVSHLSDPAAQAMYSDPKLLRAHPEFIAELFKALPGAHNFQEHWLEGNECTYHSHGEDECCYDRNGNFIG